MFRYFLSFIIFLGLLLPFYFHGNCLGATPMSPKSHMKELKKSSGDYEDIFKRLNKMGKGTAAILKDVEKDFKYLVNSKYLKRAETFTTNLDADPGLEHVSQIIF